LKAAVVVLWIVSLVLFFLPDWNGPGRYLFPGLLVVHAIECVVFLPRLRAAGGSHGQHVVQTLLFGFVHLRTLPQAA
jgi:uncharacterized protein YhhL (DUF1145 family)